MKKQNAKKQKVDHVGKMLKDKADQKAQIAARVAPEAPKKNEVKKVYALGSPGHNRKVLGVTLTEDKRRINEETAIVKVALDANGDPTGESSTFNYRDTAACTKRRREYTRRNLIGRSLPRLRCHMTDSRGPALGRGQAAAGHFRHALAHGRLGWLGRLHRTKVVVRVRALLLLAGLGAGCAKEVVGVRLAHVLTCAS